MSDFTDYHRKIAAEDAANKAVLDALPPDPHRGSYEWWAAIARENTGHHFLDSGIAYGRMYSRPVPPDTNWWDVSHNYAMPYINTIGLLANNLEADDEIAVAIEDLFMWWQKWCQDEHEPWSQLITLFIKKANRILSADPMKLVADASVYVSTEQMRDALADLPIDALRTLHTEDGYPLEIRRDGYDGGYTYNNENDLSQDFVWDSLLVDGEQYVFIQTHNGCDARGGFSTPVVAAVNDENFYFVTASPYCMNCEESWDSSYRFGEDQEDFTLDLDAVRKENEYWVAIEAGQHTLDGMPEPPPPTVTPAQLRAIESWIAEQRDGDPDHEERAPLCLVETADGWVVGDDSGKNIPSGMASVMCPRCGHYSIIF